MATINNDWNMSTDIYDIVGSMEQLKRRYIEDQDETTLALGIFGFLSDTEAKKIQTATIMTGQLGNEMFPTRANLTKNVLTHAIYNSIIDINAVPAKMIVNIGIKVEDLDRYMQNNKFIFDAKCPLFIGDYEFHLDYDIILQRSLINENTYSAYFDMTEVNRISNIVNPYLKQPFVIRIGNFDYVVFQTTVRQVSIEETTDKIISDSIIQNKTYTFEFSNQIADFDVYVNDNGVRTRLEPVLYGASTDNIEKYCQYLFISDNTIRITFDSKSYIPGLNSDIEIKAYTTLGSEGNFSYKKVDQSEEGLFIDIDSEKYNYSRITCYMIATSDSTDGTDRKTKAELQKLIPKAALSRGSITTETDVANYFSMIDTDYARMVIQKKVDNQLSRVWYGYFVLKDRNGDIIPTNTITIDAHRYSQAMIKCEDGRLLLPAGTILKYNAETRVGQIIDESEVPTLYTEDYFGDNYYYMTVYNLIINPDPLYAAFYLTITDKDSFFTYNWVNESAILQFVANRCNFQRNLLTDQSTYKFTFKIAQSIMDDFGLFTEDHVTLVDENSGETIINTVITNNMKCVLVMYNNGVPYRWVEANFVDFDRAKYISSWEVNLETDNGLDNLNRIKILDLHVAGKTSADTNYGYLNPNTEVKLYTLAKFEESYGRRDLDDIAPGFNGYTVTNIYEVEGGLTFYENFTNVLDTRVKVSEEDPNMYNITGVPVVGLHYMDMEEHASYLVDAINERKIYIDYCLTLLENSMRIDFKFFNTYGPSALYTIGDNKTMLGHVDLSMKFRVCLNNVSDIYIKDELIAAIKAYVEDIYQSDNWHAPSMITELMTKYSSRVHFIEFMNYNDFWLGLQHITQLESDDPHIVPEFLNIRNRYNMDGILEPWIDIEFVQE